MRRFIAGAVCPECRAVDRIVVEHDGDVRRRRCVSCGHSDTFLSDAAAEPPTRLTRRARGDVPATTVRFVEPDRGGGGGS